MSGITEKLRMTPSLHITARDKELVVAGTLPNLQMKDIIVKTLSETVPQRSVDASAVLISPHTTSARFLEEDALESFLRSFYGTSVPGDFSLTQEGPRLKGAATPTLQIEWLRQLREMVGGAKVDMDLIFYPSIYHFPGYRPATPLPAETLESLRRALSDFYIAFDRKSATLTAAAATRLSGLTSTLLGAGPALRLIVGGHPDSDGDVPAQRRLAQARAEQVRSFLIEQGAPATDIEAVAFDPVPSGSPGAPVQPRSVEILFK